MSKTNMAAENLRLIAENTELKNKIAQAERRERSYANQVQLAKKTLEKKQEAYSKLSDICIQKNNEAMERADRIISVHEQLREFYREAATRRRTVDYAIDERSGQVTLSMIPSMRSYGPTDGLGTVRAIRF